MIDKSAKAEKEVNVRYPIYRGHSGKQKSQKNQRCHF